jgi:hypothetical protein
MQSLQFPFGLTENGPQFSLSSEELRFYRLSSRRVLDIQLLLLMRWHADGGVENELSLDFLPPAD